MEENKVSYSEKLKDPRWQKKRLDIMQRDEFKCSICGNYKSTLNVHHKYYIYERDPWDYSDSLLITLCESCHNLEEFNKSIISDFTKVLLEKGFTNGGLSLLLSMILSNYPRKGNPKDPLDELLTDMLSSNKRINGK